MEVQKLTAKMCALNLTHQYVRETQIKNKEAVVSALSSFLRGINTDGKRAFLSADYDGFTFLREALRNATGHVRLAKKILLLIQDFV